MRPAALLLQRTRSGSVMSVPEDEPLTPGPATPPLYTPPFNMGSFNPRTRLLRRSSSNSTLGSIDDEEELEWSPSEVDKLMSVYEQCVDEASLETPFSGVPPGQLLHTIARACIRIHRDEWRHSLTATRNKCLLIVKERLAAADKTYTAATVMAGDATPRPGCDVDATPKRRRLQRNDSMDFLPHTRNLEAVARLSDKLHLSSSESGPSSTRALSWLGRTRADTCHSAGPSGLSRSVLLDDVPNGGHDGPTSAPLSGPGRLARAMTFTTSTSARSASTDEGAMFYSHTQQPHSAGLSGEMSSLSVSRPILRTGSGFSLSHGPSQPSLYSAPSFSDSAESIKSQHDDSASSFYGSSLASTDSFPASLASSTTYSTSVSTEHSIPYLATPKSRKRQHDGLGASGGFSTASSGGSAPSASWSASSLSLSTCADDGGPVTPSPIGGDHSAGPLSYFDARTASPNDRTGSNKDEPMQVDQQLTAESFLDPRYVSAGKELHSGAWSSGAPWAAANKGRGRFKLFDLAVSSHAGEQHAALESPFEQSFAMSKPRSR